MNNVSVSSIDYEDLVEQTNSTNEALDLDWLKYVFGPLGVVGMICNILIIRTVWKLDGNSSASGLAVQLLAVLDFIAILGDAIFEMVLKGMLKVDIFVLDSYGISCRVFKAIDWLGNNTANWHVVIVCLDR